MTTVIPDRIQLTRISAIQQDTFETLMMDATTYDHKRITITFPRKAVSHFLHSMILASANDYDLTHPI